MDSAGVYRDERGALADNIPFRNQTIDGTTGKTHSIVDHANEVGLLEGYGANSLIHTSGAILNPCSRHPLNEIQFLDKTKKEGACEICLPSMLRANHELLPIKQTITEVVQVLHTLDEQVLDLQQRKNFHYESCVDLEKLIESDR